MTVGLQYLDADKAEALVAQAMAGSEMRRHHAR